MIYAYGCTADERPIPLINLFCVYIYTYDGDDDDDDDCRVS
jgi:hypothetical protein